MTRRTQTGGAELLGTLTCGDQELQCWTAEGRTERSYTYVSLRALPSRATCQPAESRDQSLIRGPRENIFDQARCLTVVGSPSRCPVVPAASMPPCGGPAAPVMASIPVKPNRAAVSLSSEVGLESDSDHARPSAGPESRRPARDTARPRLDTRPARPPRVSRARAPHVRVCAGRCWQAWHGAAGRPEPGLTVMTPPCRYVRASRRGVSAVRARDVTGRVTYARARPRAPSSTH